MCACPQYGQTHIKPALRKYQISINRTTPAKIKLRAMMETKAAMKRSAVRSSIISN